jgi:hypothetical protein
MDIIRVVPGDAGHADADADCGVNPPPSTISCTVACQIRGFHGEISIIADGPSIIRCSVALKGATIDVECPSAVEDGPSKITRCSVALKGATIDVKCPRIPDGPSIDLQTSLQCQAIECELCTTSHIEEPPPLLGIANGTIGMDHHILTPQNLNLTVVVAVEVCSQCERA